MSALALSARLLVAALAVYATARSAAGEPLPLSGDVRAPTAAWCWFQSPRAIVDDADPSNTLLLVGAVVCSPDAPETHGDVGILWRNLDSGERGFVPLHRRLECDDHNSPALWRRPDGRYVASYSKHCGDRLIRSRVSVRPGDPSEWEAERVDDALGATAGGDVTYANLHELSSGKTGSTVLYNLTRAVNWDPTVLVSSDLGASWSYGGKLLTCGGDRTRPYLNYASSGLAMHFVATEQHPRQMRTSLYHGVVRGGALFDSAGKRIDDSVLDDAGVEVSRLSPVFRSGDRVGDVVLHRTWGCSVAIDAAGRPAVVFSARADDNARDHRFVYARWDGDAWSCHPLARGGGYLYEAEDDYTGLASTDPDDPSVVFLSTTIDPRSGAATEHYEIYRGATADHGQTWQWRAITHGSAMDNLRPIVPAWNRQETAVIWLRGDYRSYRDWSTEAVFNLLSDGKDPSSQASR